MKKAVIGLLALVFPAVALAGDGAAPTCDPCIDIDDTLVFDGSDQMVSGSVAGEPNSEYTYQFCAVGGETYFFSTCDTYGGTATYDTALSIWEIGGDACGVNLFCNDDDCFDGQDIFRSTISWVAPADGDYLVVVDAFSTGQGDYTMVYRGAACDAVPTESITWGEVKNTYR